MNILVSGEYRLILNIIVLLLSQVLNITSVTKCRINTKFNNDDVVFSGILEEYRDSNQ